jgi:hypothetical protein
VGGGDGVGVVGGGGVDFLKGKLIIPCLLNANEISAGGLGCL